MKVEVCKRPLNREIILAKNSLLQKDPWIGKQSLWMRVEVEKEAKNDLLAIIPLNEGRSEKKNGLL